MKTAIACILGVCGISDIKAFWKLRESILCLRKKNHRFLAGCLSFVCTLIRRRYGAGIPITEAIKPFCAPHGFHGIFISKYATVHENCTIYQQVTIGQNSFIDPALERNAPFVEENCYIGAGAKIIGPCRVGKDARIGANAIVVEDIPNGATVVLQKPRVMIRSGADKC